MKYRNYVQQTEEDRRKAKELVDLVNPIVAQSFGDCFRGDIVFFDDTVGGGVFCGYQLENIGRENIRKGDGLLKRIFTTIFSTCLYEIVGNFGDDTNHKIIPVYKRDGSVITVRPEYESQARLYAALYEQSFKREVRVRIKQP